MLMMVVHYGCRSSEGHGPSDEQTERGGQQVQGHRGVTCQYDMRSGRQPTAGRWREGVEQRWRRQR